MSSKESQMKHKPLYLEEIITRNTDDADQTDFHRLPDPCASAVAPVEVTGSLHTWRSIFYSIAGFLCYKQRTNWNELRSSGEY